MLLRPTYSPHEYTIVSLHSCGAWWWTYRLYIQRLLKVMYINSVDPFYRSTWPTGPALSTFVSLATPVRSLELHRVFYPLNTVHSPFISTSCFCFSPTDLKVKSNITHNACKYSCIAVVSYVEVNEKSIFLREQNSTKSDAKTYILSVQ